MHKTRLGNSHTCHDFRYGVLVAHVRYTRCHNPINTVLYAFGLRSSTKVIELLVTKLAAHVTVAVQLARSQHIGGDDMGIR
jgi:hypothetical protein